MPGSRLDIRLERDPVDFNRLFAASRRRLGPILG